MNILFVCSMARLRSKTAAHIFREEGFSTDYCGLDKFADRRDTGGIIQWADKIICMENNHKNKLRKKYWNELPSVEVWDIEDIYGYMDRDLIDLLRWEFKRRGY